MNLPRHLAGTSIAARDKRSFIARAFALCSAAVCLSRIGLGLNCIASVLDGNGARLSRHFG